jgi:hypothetical protein
MGSDLILANAKNIAPFSNNTNLPHPSLNAGIGGLNIVQYPPQQQQQNLANLRKKTTHGGSGTGASGSE